MREVFRAYNFQEIRTPIFESTELFARGVGEETDIVAKEMYTWEDGGGSADYELLVAWLSKHSQEITVIQSPPTSTSQRTRLGPGAQIEWQGAWALMRARYAPTHADLLQLQYSGEAWQAMSSGKNPRLVMVTLKGSVSESFPLVAKRMGIEVDELDLPKFNAPQMLTLRPENTAGVVRAYIQNDLQKRGLNKLFYIGPQFRRERPQKGRFRQFYQIGAEAIGPPPSGSESPARDAEILEMLATLLDRLGITDWNLQLNSVGCPNDREKFNEALRQALEPVKDKMCADCQRRAVTNPLRVFDCKVPEDQPIIEKLPRISQFLDEGCRTHFEAVQGILTKVGVPFSLNDRLVRGLDYYTRTAFEFTHGALGAQNAILGGGRYDGLSESLGGPAAPGIGFAIGEDRLVMSLQEKAPAESILRKPDVYIAPMAGMNGDAARLARELRRHDLIVELGDDSFRLKKSFEAATKVGAKYILIVGENEVKADAFALKNLATGEQISVARGDLAMRIRD